MLRKSVYIFCFSMLAAAPAEARINDYSIRDPLSIKKQYEEQQRNGGGTRDTIYGTGTNVMTGERERYGYSRYSQSEDDMPSFMRGFCAQRNSTYGAASLGQGRCSEQIRVGFCADFGRLPKTIQRAVDAQMTCQERAYTGRGENGSEESGFKGKSDDCAEADAMTLQALREQWGKEENMRALLFFADDFARAQQGCVSEDYGRNPGGFRYQ